MKKSPPSIIPLNYDYQKMSPSSSTNPAGPARSEATTSFYDNQYQSLFGDPVPPTPSEDYLGHLDGSLYGSYRRDSYASAIADDFNRTITLAADGGRRLSRLFSQTPISSTSVGLSPRMGPDIQILPDSGSANSSSEAQASPNYALLRPDDAARLSIDETYDKTEEADSNGVQDYTQHGQTAEDVIRRISDFSEDFKSNVGSLRDSPPDIPEPPSRYTRQISNESYSSTEWFKPIGSYPEFTKMPKMRPSSKNVLSIKHLEMPPEDSPVAAMIHDSNGSSSGEDQSKAEPVPMRPPDPQPSRLRSLHRQSSSTDSVLPSFLPPIPPPPLPLPPPPAPSTLPPPDPADPPPVARQMSPIILTEAITTGADYRVTAPRTHKKPSFSIIAEKSPQSSLEQSSQKAPTSALSPFRGHGFRERDPPIAEELTDVPQKPVAMPRMLRRKSLSSTHLKLPSISDPSNNLPVADSSPRPSVQFNMSGRRPSLQMSHQKSILQAGKDPSSSSQETPLTHAAKMKSCETLPFITDPYRTSIPRLSAPSSALTKSTVSNSNPTRKQRGLLRVINSADSNSRIPIRSNWASMDDLSTQRKPVLSPLRVKIRRRSSSTSPERRSSTQTEPRSSLASDRRSSNLSSVTTSDFSFRRNSLSPVKTPLTGRRKSIFQSGAKSTPASPSNRKHTSRTPRKVAKPTTLSPIIGTPNKDFPPSSPAKGNQPLSVSLSRRESLSQIPVLNSLNGASRSNSRLSSRGNSRVNSRSSSPYKDVSTGVISRVPSSRSPSRQSLRPESRLTSRGGSRPVSRADSSKAPSRSTSRASTRQASNVVSRANSRANSRPNSRMEQAKAVANSRSNSRLSTRSESSFKSRANSPPKKSRRSKSSSRSPEPRKTRRKSISPSKIRTPIVNRRNSRSLIPARVPISKSTSKPKNIAASKNQSVLRRESPKRTSNRKSPTSAKNLAPSNLTRGATRGSNRENTRSSIKTSSKGSTTTSKAKKPTTDVRRTPSTARKPMSKAASPTGIKSRQPSNLESRNLPKNAEQLKRETSSVRQAIIAASLLKREASSMSMKKGDAKAPQTKSTNSKAAQGPEQLQVKEETTNGQPKTLKRQPSTMALLTIGSKLSLMRKRTDSNLSKKLEDAKKSKEGGVAATNSGETTTAADGSTNGKLVALTKANVVSMTTAAITAHPVEISTVLANQLPKTNSSGQLLAGQEDMATLPAAILEKSQKTLENIQKTVTEATDEIHKTINENLTDLKTLENDMGKMSEELTGSPSPLEKSDSLKTVIENRSPKNAETKKASEQSGTIDDAFGEAVKNSPIPPNHPIEASVTVINKGNNKTINGASKTTTAHTGAGLAVDEDLAERVSERAISCLPEVDCDSANLQSSDAGLIGEEGVISGHSGIENDAKTKSTKLNSSGAKSDAEVRAGDGNGQGDATKEAGSQDPLDEESDKSKGCCKCGKCKCSSCFCMPCRRSRCSKCFRKKEKDPETAALASVEIVDEKVGCWKKMKCCKRKAKPSPIEDPIQQRSMQTISEEPEPTGSHTSATPKHGKCGLCIRKVFCCRSANKVEAVKHDVEKARKCCFCIPCRKKKPTTDISAPPAWEDPERPVHQQSTEAAAIPAATAEAPQGGCCSRFFQKLNCCKKKVPVSESRRASMKQGIVPPPEENRRKLHVDLVEFNSKMKGAIPVMPLYLAWFCAICNTLVPGLGTLLSGFFCVCVGIPRFGMYDSAKARFGSLIINCIVAVAQLFCVLFCFVGWGWSIWWGAIMLKTARKLSKIKKVEKLEEEEEKRQAQMAAAVAPTATATATDAEATKA